MGIGDNGNIVIAIMGDNVCEISQWLQQIEELCRVVPPEDLYLA